jgi:AmmeMemoRadiSam system protein A
MYSYRVGITTRTSAGWQSPLQLLHSIKSPLFKLQKPISNPQGVIMTSEKTTTMTLSPEEGQCLVRLARATIAERLKHPMTGDDHRAMQAELQAPVFASRCGVFVTLKIKGVLRGCIGSLTSSEPLAENIRHNAINAAFRDPRFPPLTPEELAQVVIEVSVLTPPEPLSYSGADDLLSRLRPGIDGVIIRKNNASATFLPQVWKQLPRRQDFLSHLCLKAGLAAQAWREEDLQVEIYQVQYFEEEKNG